MTKNKNDLASKLKELNEQDAAKVVGGLCTNDII